MKKFTYLALGAGVQSSTIAEMMATGKLPPANAVIFADTGNEPEHVYEQVSYLGARLEGISPVYTVQQGDIMGDIYGNGRFAAIPFFSLPISIQKTLFGDIKKRGQVGQLQRHCTHEYKIRPIEKKFRELLLELGYARQYTDGRIFINRGVEVNALLGITTDEAERMKANRNKKITNKYPLIDLRMSRGDCLDWLTAKGLPLPQKSSCIICPYHNDTHWNEMKKNHPRDWSMAVKLDKDLRGETLRIATTVDNTIFIHKSCYPLEKAITANQKEQSAPTQDMCDGICWT